MSQSQVHCKMGGVVLTCKKLGPMLSNKSCHKLLPSILSLVVLLQKFFLLSKLFIGKLEPWVWTCVHIFMTLS